MFKSALSAVGLVLVLANPAVAKMSVTLIAPWDGKKVPAGQQCRLFGGNGATPPMKVAGLPAGTAAVVVEFNDKSYPPLSSNGGHGAIGFSVRGNTATLPAIPGMTDKMPKGSYLVHAARSTGDYASKGYLPPCSGGQGNRYGAVIKALAADGKILEKVSIDIGRY